MRRLYRFTGSIYFTLFLLLCSLLYVAAGTLIEALFDSHGKAEQLAYKQPAFLLLLSGFFLNILVAALRRWPWQKRHIPFLLAHLGLLMILSGTAIKSQFGLQGVMRLAEGSGTDRVWLPGRLALRVEGKQYPLHKLGESPLPIQQVALYPHCEEEFCSWIKGEQAEITGAPPIPLGTDRVIEIGGAKWGVHAERKERKWSKPSTLLITEEAITVVGPSGEVEKVPIALDQIAAIDGGRGGYEALVYLPLQKMALSPEERLARQLAQLAERGELAEPLLLLSQESSPTLFAKALVEWLAKWRDTEEWLYPPGLSLPRDFEELMAGLSWETLPYSLRAGMAWSERLDGASAEELERRGWPSDRLFEIGHLLPIPPMPQLTPERKARLLSSYLRAAEIDLDHLDAIGDDLELTPLYTPLERRLTPAPPLKKVEENRPLLCLKLEGGESVSLPFQPTGRGLQWPISGGRWLARLEPEQAQLPYRVRLHDARRVNYPGTERPYSYEADLWIEEGPGEWSFHTLSMNHVYEGRDGSRLYLSNLTPGDESELQWVQLAVNRDPGKRWLTYPGALLLCLGILLLYTSRRVRAQ